MKNRTLLKRILAAGLKAAILGAITFAGLYFVLSRMTSTEGGPDVVFMLLCIVPRMVRTATGWNDPPPTAGSGQNFDLVVIALCGAVLFSLSAVVFLLLREFEARSSKP